MPEYSIRPMSDFNLFFEEGWKHIISTDALDHQLFIAALVAAYGADRWKALLVLVTAFTIGHSLTLALSVADVFRFSVPWVEFLIPCTIVFTAIYNFIQPDPDPAHVRVSYWIALIFGLIHGMGFANSIRFMLASTQTITVPLLSFNLGLEAGQLVLVAVLTLLGWVLHRFAKLPRAGWVWPISAFAALWAANMAWERFPM